MVKWIEHVKPRRSNIARLMYYAFAAVIVSACVLAGGLLLQWSLQRIDILNTRTGGELELPARITILARLADADYYSKTGARMPSGTVYMADLGKGNASFTFPPDATNFTDGVELDVEFFRIPFRRGNYVSQWQFLARPADGEQYVPVHGVDRRAIEVRGVSYIVPWEKPSKHLETPASFRYEGATVTVFESGGELTVDGKLYGNVKAGDTVDLLARGAVLINGVSRNPD